MKQVLTFAALGVALTAFALRADDPPATKPVDKGDTGLSLTGGYVIVSGEQDGKPLPKEKFAGSAVQFTKDEVIGTDKDKKHLFVAKYTLNTAKTPWVITMTGLTPDKSEATGLIEKKGDTVRIIYNLPGGKAPDDFKTDEKQNMFVLKAETKAGAGEKGTPSK